MMRWWNARTFRVPVLFAALALLLTACPEDPPEVVDDDDVVDEPADGFLTLSTGSTGGTYFPLGGAIAGVWSGELPGVNVSTQATGASVENLRLLDAGEVDIGWAVNGVAATAFEGTGEFEGEPIDDLHVLGNIYAEVMQVVARADTGIETIDDMAGHPRCGVAVVDGTATAGDAVRADHARRAGEPERHLLDVDPSLVWKVDRAGALGDGRTLVE
jgi:uncharacterized protein